MEHEDVWTRSRGPEAWRGPVRRLPGEGAAPRAAARKAQFRVLELLAEDISSERLDELAAGYATWKPWEKGAFLRKAASLLNKGNPWVLGRLEFLEKSGVIGPLLKEAGEEFVFALDDAGFEEVVATGFLVGQVNFRARNEKGVPLLHTLVRRPHAFIIALAFGAWVLDKGPRGESLLPAVAGVALDVFRTPAGGALEAVPRERAEGLLRLLGARKKQPWGASEAERAEAAEAFEAHKREARRAARPKAGGEVVTLEAVKARLFA